MLASIPKRSATLPPTAFGAIGQIASAHAIIAVTLTGVVALQGAQHYSERQIQKEVKKELKKIEIAQGGSASAGPSSPVKAASSAAQDTPSGASGGQSVRRSPRKQR